MARSKQHLRLAPKNVLLRIEEIVSASKGDGTALDADALLQPRIVLRTATLADAKPVSRFAARVFDDTFGHTATPEEMSRYIADAYNPAIQAEEIADRRAILFLAEDHGANGKPLAGFAHLILDAASIELKRIYVDARWQGRGVAKYLLDRVLQECRKRGTHRLWLTVWQQNHRAIAFYNKSGFRHCGRMAYDWGDGEEAGLIMELTGPQVSATLV